MCNILLKNWLAFDEITYVSHHHKTVENGVATWNHPVTKGRVFLKLRPKIKCQSKNIHYFVKWGNLTVLLTPWRVIIFKWNNFFFLLMYICQVVIVVNSIQSDFVKRGSRVVLDPKSRVNIWCIRKVLIFTVVQYATECIHPLYSECISF
jgi:hypothetical protein